ncbi:MAG: LamG domain-containing protein [Desulfarculaceae bacterium]|nr:LamG domain-containing protein [Desulfarculaceae bacterium]MCF8048878.1 LamG domain-containing protein [Desulfarculaceae bacterium]MCF8065639.1 LamG domain-containing protein [Desulfarculaceae bacterium]MCF8099607.1 LamG domain-containing protein [Desulfarculaceae bacterium]
MRTRLLIYLLIFGCCLGWHHIASAQTAPPLMPGIYQPGNASATALVAPQPDGSLLLRLWQGSQATHEGGFAYLGRLVARPGGKRLAGVWQSLPGSCCPGRGRQEIEVLGPEAFRFALFAPTLDRSAWPGDSRMFFRRVAGLPPSEPADRLAGEWRLTYWYTNLLPNGAPSDLVRGKLELMAQGDSLTGVWEGMPGQVSLTPTPGGALLEYRDPQAGFEITAPLVEEASGLNLAGAFNSSIGQGRLTLTRQGLPASPPGPQVSQEGNLSGVWVDTRTGNDFFKITGSDKGFSFVAYGGSLAQPRYLSKGRAVPAGPERLQGQAQDQPGQCCGNQGSFTFRRLEQGRMEVTSYWWPQGQARPPHLKGETFLLERTAKQADTATATPAGLPQIIPARSELPGGPTGAVEVGFNPGQATGQPRALFSQGGYDRRLELYLDAENHLCALMDTSQGALTLCSNSTVTTESEHTAWLIWEVGGHARLYLDGSEVAAVAMPEPWTASSAPYMVGGSRWPGRSFQGSISEVRLWPQAEDPMAPTPPGLTITPGAAQPAAEPAARASAPATHDLLRLWHPGLLRHAYAVDAQGVSSWEAQGYRLEGPIARLWAKPVTGSRPLWGYVHNQGGYFLISESTTSPAGCRPLGLLGYAPEDSGPGRVELWGLEAQFPEPLRGGNSLDRLYTTNSKTVDQARQDGYTNPRRLAYALSAKGASFTPPLLYDWAGSWRGDGWGRFFLSRRGDELLMFWYYANLKGPKFYGRYRLSPDGKTAEGVAVGQPGPKARYYRHQLVFATNASAGPRIKLTAWRLAAPLDDGRLVVFKQSRPTVSELIKSGQQTPEQEQSILDNMTGSPTPEEQYRQALQQAQDTGRLLER